MRRPERPASTEWYATARIICVPDESLVVLAQRTLDTDLPLCRILAECAVCQVHIIVGTTVVHHREFGRRDGLPFDPADRANAAVDRDEDRRGAAVTTEDVEPEQRAGCAGRHQPGIGVDRGAKFPDRAVPPGRQIVTIHRRRDRGGRNRRDTAVLDARRLIRRLQDGPQGLDGAAGGGKPILQPSQMITDQRIALGRCDSEHRA